METPAPLTIEQRREILKRSINYHLGIGFRVVSETDTSAQLIRPKQFNFLAALLWFLLFGVGLLVYLFFYMSGRDTTVYIQVDEQGRISYNGVIPEPR